MKWLRGWSAATGREIQKSMERAGERVSALLNVIARRGLTRLAVGADAGMTTAEYAVGTLAAVAFAGVLLKVLTSSSVQSALTGIIDRALK